MCSLLVCGNIFSHVLSFNPSVSMTSVSPSHLPIEYPCHDDSRSFGKLRPSRYTWWAEITSSLLSVTRSWGAWTILIGHRAWNPASSGRHRAEGLSLQSLSTRSRNKALAHGSRSGCSERPPKDV